MSRHAPRRSGVILLIVLALLALFALLGLGLVIVTSQARRISSEQAKAGRVGDPPEEVLRDVAFQALVGTNNPLSAIGPAGLLEDMYGTHDLTGTIIDVTTNVMNTSGNNVPYAGGQMILISFTNTGPDLGPGVAGVNDNANVQGNTNVDYTGNSGPPDDGEFFWPGSDDMSRAISTIDDEYSGRVFTLLSGAAQGTSTRILGYRFLTVFPGTTNPILGPDNQEGHRGLDDDQNNTNDDVFELGWPGTDDGVGQIRILRPSGPLPAIGDRFLINGREFSGPGIGFSSAIPVNRLTPRLLDASDPDFNANPVNQQFPFALLPNPTSQNYQFYLKVGPDGRPGVGFFDDDQDGNTDFDATTGQADFDEIGWPGSDDGLLFANEDYDAPDFQNPFLALQLPSGDTLLPSYHRPDLINYWARSTDIALIDSTPMQPRHWWNSPTSNAAVALALRRKVLLRPSPDDQPWQDSGAASASNPGGNLPPDIQTALFEFREPFFDNDGNGYQNNNEIFWDLDEDGEWDAGDFDFTGKPFNPITGPWDVDSDGDGKADAIWIDPGLPVQITAEGRQYKRLAAYLIVDLDGRLNLNAHGNPTHLAAPPFLPGNQVPLAGATVGSYINPLNLPRGEGYGPAEVNLRPVVQTELYTDTNGNGQYDGNEPDATGDRVLQSELYNLMYGHQAEPFTDTNNNGRYDLNSVTIANNIVNFDEPFGDLNRNGVYDDVVDGRYGEAYLWPSAYLAPQPGRTGPTGFDDNVPAAVAALSPESARQGFNGTATIDGLSGDGLLFGFNRVNPYVPILPGAVGAMASVYGSPPAPKGLMAHGLDLRGQPYYLGSTYGREALNDPYQLDLSREGRRGKQLGGNPPVAEVDKPFGPDELEGLLRWFDIDAQSLPNRLKTLLPELSKNAANRRRVTTESWDLPTPALLATSEILHGLRELGVTSPPQSIADLVRGKIRIMDASAHLPNQPIDYTTVSLANPQQIQRINLLTRGLLGLSTPTANQSDGFEGLSPELLYGQRFDLNRPFGNNTDDSLPGAVGFGVVDEPTEVYAGERLWAQTMLDPTAQPTAMAVAANNNNTLVNVPTALTTFVPGFATPQRVNPGELARYRYAKHLYILLMLLQDRDYLLPTAQDDASLLIPERRELTTRRLAQFAINVVDYRDSDSIMTPFEYDAHPFTDERGNDYNPWDVDGELRPSGIPLETENGATTVDYREANQWGLPRRVVWGCEFPELLLTETLAFHDRRVADRGVRTTEDMVPVGGDGQADDTHFDQVRVPQGSAFFELYCVRNANHPLSPVELYVPAAPPATPTQRLDLGRMAPASSTGEYPVWRLAISYSVLDDTQPGDATVDNDVRHRVNQRPDSVSLQPEDFNLVFPPSNLTDGPPVHIDRIVWFTQTGPGPTTIDQTRIYHNRSTALPLLTPGQYAVVGPARETVTGPANVTSIGVGPNVPPYTQQISLGQPVMGQPVRVTDNFDVLASRYVYPTIGAEIQTPLGIPVAGTTLGGRVVGISVSEPRFLGGDGYNYYGPGTGATNYSDTRIGPIQTTEDLALDDTTAPFDNMLEPSGMLGTEFGNDLHTRTQTNYRTVFLQRLANPLLPHNPDVGKPGHDPAYAVNPYITIDWMPIDLTIFNSEDRPSNSPYAGVEISDRLPPSNVRFGSRQRGFSTQPFNVWEQQSEARMGQQDPIAATDAMGNLVVQSSTTHFFNPLLDQTLGYVNRSFHDPTLPLQYGPAPFVRGWWVSPGVVDGYTNNDNPYELIVPTFSIYDGDPITPFPWLQWANRPYTSNLELLQVPSSSPSRLLHEYTLNLATGGSSYQDRNLTNAASSWPYGHLANLFYSTDFRGIEPGNLTPPPPPNLPPVAGNLHRLFEFVHVPSRFSGTETMLDPIAFKVPSPYDSTAAPLYPFYAPFNRISRYREPGRVNINTIYDEPSLANVPEGVWPGVTNFYPGHTNYWDRVWLSRQGYVPNQLFVDSFPLNPGFPLNPPAYSQMFVLDVNSPTLFANPFRSYGGTYQVPAEVLRWQNLMRGATPVRRNFVDSGLLRASIANNGQNSDDPLLALDQSMVTNAQYLGEFNNPDRNPAFRYQQYQKLGNILTTRSNVFAVWVTVGMFEVERVPNSAVHPDGYRLVRELNSDTGDMERHRAFYVIDRTIPVGFQRGRKNNVRDAILLERFIE